MNGESFRDSIIPPTGYVGSPEASVPVEPGVDQQEYIQFLEDARSHARQKTEDLGSSPIAFKQLGEDLTHAAATRESHSSRTQRAIDSMGAVLRIMLGRK